MSSMLELIWRKIMTHMNFKKLCKQARALNIEAREIIEMPSGKRKEAARKRWEKRAKGVLRRFLSHQGMQ